MKSFITAAFKPYSPLKKAYISTTSKIKVAIADTFSQNGLSELIKLANVCYIPKLTGVSLEKEITLFNPQILIVRSKKLNKDLINSSTTLSAVIRAGVGYDTIDIEHCCKKGITVSNCPGKNSIAVAELTMGLILALDRRIAENDHLIKIGKWNKASYANCIGLYGRTLGLIGTGNIGKEVAKRALSFGMKVAAFDKYSSPEGMQGIYVMKSLEELIRQSDIISLHIPKTKETNQIINRDTLAKMRADAVLVNTARGELVNEEDILERLSSVKGFYYGCDVIMNEPAKKECEFKSKIAMHEKVCCTHHIGASTLQAEEAIGMEAVRMVRKYIDEGIMDNIVNKKKL